MEAEGTPAPRRPDRGHRSEGPCGGDPYADPRPWEVWAAWVLRLLIVATGIAHLWRGEYLFALLCLAVIGLLVAPLLLAGTSRANLPIEVELAALWGAVGDITLGGSALRSGISSSKRNAVVGRRRRVEQHQARPEDTAADHEPG